MFEQTKALCDRFLQMGVPGFDLIVYQDGECVLRHMGGYADREQKIPMQGKEKYHIYSCSKLFTCVAALQLWEQGKFSLEDPLADYLPAFKQMYVKTEDGIRPAQKPILVGQLFTMTSGMNYDLQTPALQEYYKTSSLCPTVELVNELAKTPLGFEPGESWEYSLSHDVLGALVEVLSGQKFEDYVKDHIFAPLGMDNSDFLHPMEDWEGFAKQYLYDEATGAFNPWWENTYRPGSAYASGGAGAVSTVEDYIKFLEALRIGDVILKKETIAMMATNCLVGKQLEVFETAQVRGSGYGLGVRTPWTEPDRTEFGWGGAAGAYLSVDPVNKLSIYYAQHVVLSPNMPLRGLIYELVKADLRGETYQPREEELLFDPRITF